MANNGKLEAAIHIPSGGWDLTLTDGIASAATVTIPGDGYCYLSAAGDLDGLLAELKQQLDATGDTYTVTLSDTTGKVTITNTDAPGGFTSITWVDTDLRDVLGFTGNLSGANAYTGTNQARALWLPGHPYSKRNGGNWAGDHFTDYSSSIAPNGSGYMLMGSRRRELALAWRGVTQAKTWTDNESTTNESFERFLLDCIWGEAAFGQPGGPIAFYPDETDDNTYNEFRVAGLRSFAPAQFSENYDSVWVIELPRLVLLPS